MADTNPGAHIRGEDSFLRVVAESRHIAALYFFMELDCLVDLARLVSVDFFHRPQLYVTLGDENASARLARFHARYGADEAVLAVQQRTEIFRAAFGERDSDDFPRLRSELIAAATAFAERVYDTGEEMLRERVRTAHRPLKEYLVGMTGSSLRWSTEVALTGVTQSLAYPILRDAGVCSVFGIAAPPSAQWPFTEDANADKLVEEISKQLSKPQGESAMITRASISNRQRAALRGAEALVAVLDFNEDGDGLVPLITKCYTWGSALASVEAASKTPTAFPG